MKKNFYVIALIIISITFIGCEKETPLTSTSNNYIKSKKSIEFPNAKMKERYNDYMNEGFNFDKLIESESFFTYSEKAKEFVNNYLGVYSMIIEDFPFSDFMKQYSKNTYHQFIEEMESYPDSYLEFLHYSELDRLEILEIVDYIIDDDFQFAGLYRFWSRMAFAGEYTGMQSVNYIRDIIDNVNSINGYNIIEFYFSVENDEYLEQIRHNTGISCRELAEYDKFRDLISYLSEIGREASDNIYNEEWHAETNLNIIDLERGLADEYPVWRNFDDSSIENYKFIVVNTGMLCMSTVRDIWGEYEYWKGRFVEKLRERPLGSYDLSEELCKFDNKYWHDASREG